MTVAAIIGAQWGDEGKGKVIDELAGQADFIVRYQGGNNAGHRVVHGDREVKFNLVPSGILYPSTTCIIGNGVVVNPQTLLNELANLQAMGIDTSKLCISERAHVVMPYHVLLDRLEEESKGNDKIGTTQKGIGPAYVDKYSRIGIRMADLLDKEIFRSKLEAVLTHKNRMITQIYGEKPLNLEEIYDEYFQYGQMLKQYIIDTQSLLQQGLYDGKSILLEGAQGSLLDVDFGTYPFVSSSSTIAGNAFAGSGLPPRSIDHVIGIFKAYITRVGSGPMPTEQFDSTGDEIRDRGHEFGTVTGRPRRCGWFDGVLARFVSRLNGVDFAVIMKLDVFDTFETVKICTSYRLRGQEIHTPPANLNDFAACEPIYEEMPGWLVDTSNITSFEELPKAAQNYLTRLENLIGAPIAMVSTGPSRGQTIRVQSLV